MNQAIKKPIPSLSGTLSVGPYSADNGAFLPEINLHYQRLGRPLGTAPVIFIAHGLSSNSRVAGPGGWWNALVGPGLPIDTKLFTVLAFDTPGNGHATENPAVEAHYKSLHVGDVAAWYGRGLQQLGVDQLYAAVGLSLGGGVVWEMAARFPKLIEHLVPIVGDWKSTDWVIASNRLQAQALKHSPRPVEDARMIAMMFYRNPASLNGRFDRKLDPESGEFGVESWLLHHGDSLASRFSRQSYLVMNHFLSSIDITRDHPSFDAAVADIQSKFHLVAVDSDLLFVPEEIGKSVGSLQKLGKAAYYHEIKSSYGHDAFLVENEQVARILKRILKVNSFAHRQFQ